ncbi:MAG: FAD:protein FMN transferase [Acidobacteriaceae bacterium]|nr:FAD:protein FMN transferase [Acidobacteriaceae bacterium]
MAKSPLTFSLATLLLITAAIAGAADGLPTRYVKEEGAIDTMGSLMSIVAYGGDAARVKKAISDGLDEADRLDIMLSNYKPESQWSEMNRMATQRPVHVSKELFDLLADCQEYSRESEGTFDISVGPLMKIWGFYKGSGHLAKQEQVENALTSVGYRNVILDRNTLTVRFARAGVELDPGGIGKGYAVDRVVDVLQKEGIRAALVSAGGSSIYALGAPPDQTGWRIELRDGRNASGAGESVTLRDESVSTSGNYEKFFYADGKLWSHIMDPRTGYPSTGMISVSVIAPRTVDSEAWAKPYYILGRSWTARHKKKDFRVFMCEDDLKKPCAWVN